MIRLSYVNGRFVPRNEAQVSIEDRGYQFADGVYEVIAFYNRIMVDGDLHIQRLFRSLKELDIPIPMSEAALHLLLQETMHRNQMRHGSLYIQVTRGVAKRDHIYKKGLKPSLVISVMPEKKINPHEMAHGGAAIARPDIRWLRRDIKSTSLLTNMLLKNEATRLGKREVWLYDNEGYITEASVSNAFIVNAKGELQTRPNAVCLLPGITRHRLLLIAKEISIPVREASFTLEDVYQAKEAFVSASTSHMAPIVQMEDKAIGDGKVGEMTTRLFNAYMDYIKAQTGVRPC